MAKERDVEKKLRAAYRLLTEGEISHAGFEDVRELVKGIDKRVDRRLKGVSEAMEKVRMVREKDLEGLTEEAVEALPEDTEEKKKRKKTLLLLLRTWRELRAEVKRVLGEFGEKEEMEGDAPRGKPDAGTVARLIGAAKGPLGLLTGIAIVVGGLIAYLNSSAVEIVIANQGCNPLTPSVELPVSIPGLVLPTQPIPDGGQGVAKVPGMTYTVDGTRSGVVRVSVLRLNLAFQLGGRNMDLLFNGESLLGQRTSLDLDTRPRHELVVRCNK